MISRGARYSGTQRERRTRDDAPRRSLSNVIEMFVDRVRVRALVDTGAAVCVMDTRLLWKVTNCHRTASAQDIHPLASCTARVGTEVVVYAIEFIVISFCSNDVILGWEFLSRHNPVIDCAQAEIEFAQL